MVDTFGKALRQLRQAEGLSLEGLASRVFASKSLVAMVEAGTRQPQADFAELCDRALGTAPLLATLAAMEGDSVKRRALLAHIGAAATVVGPGALAQLVRSGLLDAGGVDDDYDGLVADYRHRLTVDGSPGFGVGLLGQLLVWQHQLVERSTPELLRAVAGLGQVYGLWLGNTGDLAAADGWYRTAGGLAQRSGDRHLESHVRGRAASRGIYEGWSVRRTLDQAEHALVLAAGAPVDGALEAHAARIHVHALTGDTAAGRRSVNDMREVAERTGDEPAIARTLFLKAFGEARYGDVAAAIRAYEEARPVLGPRPLWLTEARVYLGRAHVAAGDVDGGAEIALQAVRDAQHDVRVVGVAVRDVVHAAGGRRSAVLDELAPYADQQPGPWETLR